MARFYLAAKYDKRLQLVEIAEQLRGLGHMVQAEWLDGSHESGRHNPADWAARDMFDIDACTHFVLFNLPLDQQEPSSGRFFEFGYAVACGKICMSVGPGECIFLACAQRFETLDGFLAEVRIQREESAP